MIRIGLIGLGGMGGVHASCYEALRDGGGCRVVAVADPVREKVESFAGRFGAKAFATGVDLIEKADVDMVDICVPTFLHAEHVLRAMGKGVPVLVEKPVCLLEDEARQLLEMKRKTGAIAAVGHCIRFWEEYVYLKDLVENRTYGRLLHGVFTRLSPRPTGNPWFLDERKSGLAALDLHIHDVDFARFVLGSPLSMKCEILPAPQGTEHIFSLYRYGDVVVSLEGGWDYPSGFPFEMAYRVGFEHAALTYSSARTPTLWLVTEDGKVQEPFPPSTGPAAPRTEGGNLPSHGGHFNEIRYVVGCLNQGKEPAILSLEEGIASFRMTLREIEAARR